MYPERTPFTIKILYDKTEYTQPLTLGIDTVWETIGSAAVDDNGSIVYMAEIEKYNDIVEKW